MKRSLRLFGSPAAVLLAAALAGCGPSAVAAPSTSAPPVAASATPTGPVEDARAVAATPTAGPATTSPTPGSGSASGSCRLGQLAVKLAGDDAASGHRAVVIEFRNTGRTACSMRGYPGVAALDGGGRQVAQAVRLLAGYLGGTSASKPQQIVLPAGGSASALVEADAANPDGTACTGWKGLLITPPDDTRSFTGTWKTDACADLQIHPVVSGTTGRST